MLTKHQLGIRSKLVWNWMALKFETIPIAEFISPYVNAWDQDSCSVTLKRVSTLTHTQTELFYRTTGTSLPYQLV